MLLWTKVNEENKINKYDIFYAELSNNWEIGSIDNDNNNLFCNVDIKYMYSPIECNKWFDYNYNEIDYIILNNGKCEVDIDIQRLNEENNENNSIFDDKIKITFYSILVECLCIFILCVYCKWKCIWRNIRYRNSNDGRHQLVSDEPNDEIDIQRLNPMDIQQILNPIDNQQILNPIDNQHNPLIELIASFLILV